MDLVINLIQNGQLGTRRHIPLGKEDKKESEAAFIATITPGDLS